MTIPPLERAPGFMVWNATTGRMPTVVHDTLDRALTEAERLTYQNRGQRFVLMGPVLEANAKAAKHYSEGKREGMAQSHREIMRAEAMSDRLSDENERLRRERDLLRRMLQRSLNAQIDALEVSADDADHRVGRRLTDDEIPF